MILITQVLNIYVSVLRPLVRLPQLDCRGLYLQETKGKSGQKDKPAIQWQLQPENISDREQQHDHIRDDVEGTGHAENEYPVSALSLEEVLVVPIIVHILADQHRRQRRAERVAEDHGHDGSAPSLQGGEDLDVEEKYRYFVEAACYCPEYLQRERDLTHTLVAGRKKWNGQHT